MNRHHIDTIVRTNLATAYSAGRYEETMAVSATRPYWQYIAVLDKSTRQSHEALNGLVYPFDDIFWDYNYPPNGYNCRCDVITLSERQLNREGLQVEKSDTKQPFKINEAFSTSPKELYKPDTSQWSAGVREKYTQSCINYAEAEGKDLSKLLPETDMKYATAMKSAKSVAAYSKLVDERKGDMKPKGEIINIGKLSSKVVRFLEGENIVAGITSVMITDHKLIHIMRTSKVERGAALTIDEIKNIPAKFRVEDTEWYFDTEHRNTLMVNIRDKDSYIKVAININRKIGGGIANEIITAGRIARGQIDNQKTEPKKYKKI